MDKKTELAQLNRRFEKLELEHSEIIKKISKMKASLGELESNEIELREMSCIIESKINTLQYDLEDIADLAVIEVQGKSSINTCTYESIN
ncbi:MAG: hypothetical protein HOC24_07610 [Deltaproteobacteria bacterium]|jgi:chromosome segregation ATPase|nr:hypothetical protein [Deltaproteobacteria bacterium]